MLLTAGSGHGDEMKAIILAAGHGSRLAKYTSDLPKGMLMFRDKPLVRHQVDAYREYGVEAIIVVRGFRGEAFDLSGVRYYENPIWDQTNMVESLICAREEFDSDLLVSYADILFSTEMLRAVAGSAHEVTVAVDIDWEAYWQKRYGRVDVDTESLVVDSAGNIQSLGLPDPPTREIDGRYVGLLKFSRAALQKIEDLYDSLRETIWDEPWQQSGSPFRQAHMTDLLQALIDQGEQVHAQKVRGGWLEFDTNEDYEKQRDWDIAL